jgi:protein-S-isoprenylcysteine O-methyltransferase Ste14
MTFELRGVIQVIASLVWMRHFLGAARTFRLPAGERPSRAIHLFPLATGAMVYAMFRSRLETRLVAPGLVFLLISLLLFEWARLSVKGRFFSYLYAKDTPEFLWTSGPYAYIRNPFYASYLLSYAAIVLMFPSLLPLAVLAGMSVFFFRVARYEEKKFERSPLASQYSEYVKRTGRFFPKLL